MGDRRGAYRVLVGSLRERKLLGRPRHTWEDNSKVNIQEILLKTWTGLM